MARILSIDLETYSDVDLPKCGVYRYIEGDFHILLFAYAFDDEEPHIIDVASGEELPQEVADAIFDPDTIKSAWNAQFERTCMSKYFGRQLSPDSWRCSMVHAASLSLPLRLEDAALVLKTGEKKDKLGEELIRYFSIPCKPTKTNGGRNRNLPEHDPAKWQLFKEYCLQDVRTERAIRKRLEQYPLPEHEWDYYHMDQRINDRGVMIDHKLVEQAIACDTILSEVMTQKAYELTGLENPNSVSQLKIWLDERGIPMDSLGKKDVAALITDLDKHSTDQEALDMLKLRLQMAKSSVKKYQAADRYICKDSRARGLFQFSGANRTQRWSGRGIQLQNLVRNEISTLDEARELLKMGAFDVMAMVYDNPPDILSQLCRTMLIPKPGCRFVIADYSAIEARVLAWLAGEEWRITAFNNGEDIYCASASQMFGVPVVKHGINGELRQKGKVAELACIAEGQLVLTDCGLIPIEKVTTKMKVWDGKEWVSHDGVVFKGEREVISYEGLTATSDHLVWVEGQARPIQFGIAASCGTHLLQTGDGGRAVRMGEDYQSGETMERKMEPMLCTDSMSGVWFHSMAEQNQLDTRSFSRLSKLYSAKGNTAVVGSKVDCCETTVRKPKRSRVSQLWSARDKVRVFKCNRGWTFFNSRIWSAGKKYGDRPDRYERTLRTRKYSLRRSKNQLWESAHYSSQSIRAEILALFVLNCYKETVEWINQRRGYSGCGACGIGETEKLARYSGKVKVYDIRNAGRHHRFTVSGKLVHNCGYGGASGALISMGALDMGLKEEELPEIINSWRTANPRIVQFWWDVEKAAVNTVKDHMERKVGRIGFQYHRSTLWLVLPSGRKLAYINPKMQPNRFGRMAITYEGVGANNKWSRGETYSGKLVENVTQATARDLLAESMWRMEQAGMDIVGHVHDEVILEVPVDSVTVEDAVEIMSINPAWADGLPLNAAGYYGPNFYFKD